MSDHMARKGPNFPEMRWKTKCTMDGLGHVTLYLPDFHTFDHGLLISLAREPLLNDCVVPVNLQRRQVLVQGGF
jgi:hypothetical protein